VQACITQGASFLIAFISKTDFLTNLKTEELIRKFTIYKLTHDLVLTYEQENPQSQSAVEMPIMKGFEELWTASVV
jgi:hypothetical protein